MRLLALAMYGGAIGSGKRYLVNNGAARLLGTSFPRGIFFIDVTGCFAMGLLAGILMSRQLDVTDLRTFLATGILGGYITFSAFSLDFANLVRLGEVGAATLYAAGSVILSLIAVLIGLWLPRFIAP
jgi:CrcB protein